MNEKQTVMVLQGSKILYHKIRSDVDITVDHIERWFLWKQNPLALRLVLRGFM